jgi:CheY-like chemotaxis protein
MTAKVQPQEVEQFKSYGALDVIAKPFDPMALSGQIAAVWQGRDEK